ncbi:MAG: flavodoxin family protein [Candidatus Roizmanbacteria bacterium]
MNILVLYGTLTGNTMLMAEHLSAYIQSLGHSVTLIDQSQGDIQKMKAFDLLILGASTWGDGDPNPTTDSFITILRDTTEDLSDIKYAIFGLGDRNYDHFCGVVDKLESILQSKNAKEVFESLRLDGFPDEEMEKTIDIWINTVLNVYSPKS